MDVHPEAWFCPHSQDTFLKFNSSTTISLAENTFILVACRMLRASCSRNASEEKLQTPNFAPRFMMWDMDALLIFTKHNTAKHM